MPATKALASAPDGSAASEMAFDRRVLEDMFGQEQAVVAAVLATFLDSAAVSLAQLPGAARDGGDLCLVAELAHRIKGAARMSGAMALGQAAQGLEQMAKAGDQAGSLLAVRQLDLHWRHLLSDPVLRTLAGIPAAGMA